MDNPQNIWGKTKKSSAVKDEVADYVQPEKLEQPEQNDDLLVSEVSDVNEYNDPQKILEETESIIANISNDGYAVSDIYGIQHNFSSADFTKLEKFAVELATLLGDKVEIDEPEETEEGNSTIYVFSAVTEHSLVSDEIMGEINSFLALCNKFNVLYDGWGTYVDNDEEDNVEETE